MRRPAGLLFVVALLCITARLWLPGLGKWLAYPASPHRADAIVVLGGDYPQRVLHGITLYQQGLARELWHTGHIPGRSADVQNAVQLAMERGVPDDAIQVLSSTSTWEDGAGDRRVGQTTQRTKRVDRDELVPQPQSNMCRAATIAKQRRPRVLRPAAGQAVKPDNWWRSEQGRQTPSCSRSWAKIGYYWVRYGMAPVLC